MTNGLPDKVRYIKNGAGGGWWRAASANGQVHLGWSDMPGEVLVSGDLDSLAAELRSRRYADGKRGFRQDLNQLLALLDHPSQYLWITFQDGCMWWCTVRDGITLNPEGESRDRGHFWLTCARPWTNQSLAGRVLAVGNLSGRITRTAGFQGTLCEPVGSEEILRVIHDGEDAEAAAADVARRAYEAAILLLVRRLHPKDFELLVDLILSRTGWARVAHRGGATEGVDIEAVNAAINELAFVQVKSTADQRVLADYIARFRGRARYQRMIFAVHTPKGALTAEDPDIQIWDGPKIAELVVKHGLGDWVASRL